MSLTQILYFLCYEESDCSRTVAVCDAFSEVDRAQKAIRESYSLYVNTVIETVWVT